MELNFTVAFLLIRKTWDIQFVGKRGGESDFEMGVVDTPSRTILSPKISQEK